MRTKRHSRAIATAVVILVAPILAHAAAAPEHGATIEVWVRKPASSSAGEPAAKGAGRDRLQAVTIDSLPLVEAKQVDVQYHGAFVFKGIGLDALIARYAPPPDVDLALLHFANGMQVPLAFRDAEVVKRLSPFLARGMRLGPGSPMRIARFPERQPAPLWIRRRPADHVHREQAGRCRPGPPRRSSRGARGALPLGADRYPDGYRVRLARRLLRTVRRRSRSGREGRAQAFHGELHVLPRCPRDRRRLRVGLRRADADLRLPQGAQPVSPHQVQAARRVGAWDPDARAQLHERGRGPIHLGLAESRGDASARALRAQVIVRHSTARSTMTTPQLVSEVMTKDVVSVERGSDAGGSAHKHARHALSPYARHRRWSAGGAALGARSPPHVEQQPAPAPGRRRDPPPAISRAGRDDEGRCNRFALHDPEACWRVDA